MANRVTITNLRPTDRFVNPTSRYANSTVLLYSDKNLLTYDTYKKSATPDTADPDDRVAVIPPGFEYRPDLVSNQAYSTPDFWWKIMEFNDIKDIFDFKAGRTIRIPVNPF